MKQQIIDRYFDPMAHRAGLDDKQQAVVSFALDLALSDMELACVTTHAMTAKANAKSASDVHALEARIQEQDGELLRLGTLEDRLTQWLSSRGVMLNQYDNDLYAAIIGASGNEALLSKLQEAQNTIAYLTEDRNRLKRQMADLENTIDAVREVEQARPVAMSVTDKGTLTIHNAELVTHHNGNGHTAPIVALPKPRRIDFAGSNEELRDLVFAACQLFHKQNGRAPSHADWKQVGPAANLPSVNTIEARLGMRWTEVAKAAGLEPNAKFNARSEVKAEHAEATFPR